jgi:hypothetical protein
LYVKCSESMDCDGRMWPSRKGGAVCWHLQKFYGIFTMLIACKKNFKRLLDNNFDRGTILLQR